MGVYHRVRHGGINPLGIALAVHQSGDRFRFLRCGLFAICVIKGNAGRQTAPRILYRILYQLCLYIVPGSLYLDIAGNDSRCFIPAGEPILPGDISILVMSRYGIAAGISRINLVCCAIHIFCRIVGQGHAGRNVSIPGIRDLPCIHRDFSLLPYSGDGHIAVAHGAVTRIRPCAQLVGSVGVAICISGVNGHALLVTIDRIGLVIYILVAIGGLRRPYFQFVAICIIQCFIGQGCPPAVVHLMCLHCLADEFPCTGDGTVRCHRSGQRCPAAELVPAIDVAICIPGGYGVTGRVLICCVKYLIVSVCCIIGGQDLCINACGHIPVPCIGKLPGLHLYVFFYPCSTDGNICLAHGTVTRICPCA